MIPLSKGGQGYMAGQRRLWGGITQQNWQGVIASGTSGRTEVCEPGGAIAWGGSCWQSLAQHTRPKPSFLWQTPVEQSHKRRKALDRMMTPRDPYASKSAGGAGGLCLWKGGTCIFSTSALQSPVRQRAPELYFWAFFHRLFRFYGGK